MTSLKRAPLPDRDMHTLEEDYAAARCEQTIKETKEELPAQDGHLHIDVADSQPETSPAGASHDTHDLDSPSATIVTQLQSSVNAPRSREDGKKFWGGKTVDSVKAVEGNISLFSDECLSIHGLYDAFYSRNGWGRTAVYLGSWLFFGAFFLFLTLPLVADYNTRVVTTQVDFQEGTTDGLPLPIVTVCPHGNGIRCDCLLWRKLHCRYIMDVPNEEWQQRFTSYGCIDEFEYDPRVGLPFWVDPQCEDFSNENITLVDPCRASQSEIEELPFLENATLTAMFDTVVAREATADGPFMTYEEVMVYGARRLTRHLNFFKGHGALAKQSLEVVPERWVRKAYLEPSRFQICVQIRAPYSEKQTMAGAKNGITIFVDHMTDDLYTFNDFDSATPAVDVHINVIDQDRYDDTILYVERHNFFPVAAGSVSYVDYAMTARYRKQGWGPAESQSCANDVLPRASCVEKTLLDRAIVNCNCSDLRFLEALSDSGKLSNIAGCSASKGTDENECIAESPLRGEVSLEECPTQCEATLGEVQSSFQVKLSEKQARYTRNLLAFHTRITRETVPVVDTTILQNETAIIRIGVNSLFRTKFVEDSKVPLGSLLGQIGGNAGLWCGLSFVLMIESIEFVIVALLYGSGFYSGGGKGLRHRVRSMFGSKRRTKTSKR